MRDCKILSFPKPNSYERVAKRLSSVFSDSMKDHPVFEQELNVYLSQGYHIVGVTTISSELYIVLERST